MPEGTPADDEDEDEIERYPAEQMGAPEYAQDDAKLVWVKVEDGNQDDLDHIGDTLSETIESAGNYQVIVSDDRLELVDGREMKRQLEEMIDDGE